jgi:class 3 adenylate cyclase
MIKTLQSGRDAFDRHDWATAVERLNSVDRETRLAAEDLERLGTARWWVGQLDEATDAFERAFAAYQQAGRPTDAARTALELAYRAFRGLASPIAASWLAQAGRLLAGAPESGSHAWLGVFNTIGAFEAQDIDQAIASADEAMAIARRQDEPGALFVAMSFKGSAELQKGHVEAGLALIDEAAASVSSGRLDVRVASDIYCNTIAACRNIGDLERSAQWAAEGERWMQRNGVAAYPGVCRLHRAELKMLHGNWSEAEQEARLACQELERYRLLDVVGYGHYQVGEVRLRMGDLDGAAAAFDRAYEYGHDAQPGIALLQLARGEVPDARRSIDRALATAAGSAGVADRVTRGRLLPARIEIALASGDLEAAREAVDELESVAAAYARPLFRAGAMTARGELLLGEDKAAEASPVLDQSWRLWQASDLPYESARARLHYAEALAAEGDEATARRDLQAARAVFERLGATLDLERVDALLRAGGAAAGAVPGAAGGSKSGARVAKTFMFTDIVTSTDLVAVIGDEAWSDVLGWHDRELRSAFATHSGEEVMHTGDGFFVAFERAVDAIACAVDVQRRLARHRREHGFAPWVRIGLHAADATRKGSNYTGAGVHVAARVGAAADRDEILVSSSVLGAAGSTRFSLSEPRSVTLKGVREPVELRSVDWR